TERDERDDEEPEPLVGEVPALAPERPQAVERVVVRHRHDERAGRRREVVEAGPVQERRVDGEVDDVAAPADGAELRELDPVVACLERSPGAQAHGGFACCRRALHRWARLPDQAVEAREATRTSTPGRMRCSPARGPPPPVVGAETQRTAKPSSSRGSSQVTWTSSTRA